MPTILIRLSQYSTYSTSITHFMCLLSGLSKDSFFFIFFKIPQHFFCQRLFNSIKCLLVLIFPFETAFSFTRSYKTADISNNRSMNLWFHATIPKNDLRASFDPGSYTSAKAFSLSGLGFRPFSVKTYPKNSILFIARWHFFGDSASPFLLDLCNTFDNGLIMLLNVVPPPMISSL